MNFALSGLPTSDCLDTQGCALGYRMLAFQAKGTCMTRLARRGSGPFFGQSTQFHRTSVDRKHGPGPVPTLFAFPAARD